MTGSEDRTAQSELQRDASSSKLAMPLVVGVTGHRELLPDEVPAIREQVREFLSGLSERYPDCRLRLMLSLAEGAEQLVAEEALAMDIPFVVVLPVPRVLYVNDFRKSSRRENFERLCDAAYEVFELPVAPGNSADAIKAGGEGRDRQNAQAGAFLSDHCHLLLALWDGKDNHESGDVSQVVRYHHHAIMPGFLEPGPASPAMLAVDESDLVQHLVCSRNRTDGQPRRGFKPLERYWLCSDQRLPNSLSPPGRYDGVFELLNAFSSDAQQHAQRIREGTQSLNSGEGAQDLPGGIRKIDRFFRIADWLADHYQRKSLLILGTTHVLALLMGIMYIIYTSIFTASGFIIAFVSLFAMTTAIYSYGRSRHWQRRALDYRALAEGLRVQFYWAAAGISRERTGRHAFDGFLQMQDPELGWIRHVMRVAATTSDAAPVCDDEALAFAEREWIGRDDSGRLGYYRQMGEERQLRQRRTERQSVIGLWIGIIAISVIVIIGVNGADIVREPLIWLMGVILLLAVVRQSYAHGTADAETIRQYEFLADIFQTASQRIADAINRDERRSVLHALGAIVLEEQARWVLQRRERDARPG